MKLFQTQLKIGNLVEIVVTQKEIEAFPRFPIISWELGTVPPLMDPSILAMRMVTWSGPTSMCTTRNPQWTRLRNWLTWLSGLVHPPYWAYYYGYPRGSPEGVITCCWKSSGPRSWGWWPRCGAICSLSCLHGAGDTTTTAATSAPTIKSLMLSAEWMVQYWFSNG